MADGYARVSGKHGVVIGQNGPGISNCVTAVAAAFWAHSPVVMITPETGTMGQGLGGFQEANQLPMFQEFVKYQGHIANENRMAEITARCFDRAMSEIGPTQLNIPRDRFYGDIDVEIPAPMVLDRGAGGKASLDARPTCSPRPSSPSSSAGVVVMGDAMAEAVALAERLGAPVVNSYLHNDSFPASHPQWCGPLGYQGLEGGDEAHRPGRCRARARHPAWPVRNPAAARHGLLAQGRQDHSGRRRPQDARSREADLRRHPRRCRCRRRSTPRATRRPDPRLRRNADTRAATTAEEKAAWEAELDEWTHEKTTSRWT